MRVARWYILKPIKPTLGKFGMLQCEKSGNPAVGHAKRAEALEEKVLFLPHKKRRRRKKVFFEASDEVDQFSPDGHNR
jgi:hypothetical protein